MTSRALRWAAALAVLALAGSARAEVKDAAELLPAQTLACVEVRQPERLAREISALVKGSVLDDMPAVMADLREKLGDRMPYSFYETAMLSVLFSPEMINECGRIQGGIVGVTNVGKDGPEVVGVILAGDSNLPTFYMRAMLTADYSVRGVAEAEGVRIYRERRQNLHSRRAGPAAGRTDLARLRPVHGPAAVHHRSRFHGGERQGRDPALQGQEFRAVVSQRRLVQGSGQTARQAGPVRLHRPRRPGRAHG